MKTADAQVVYDFMYKHLSVYADDSLTNGQLISMAAMITEELAFRLSHHMKNIQRIHTDDKADQITLALSAIESSCRFNLWQNERRE